MSNKVLTRHLVAEEAWAYCGKVAMVKAEFLDFSRTRYYSFGNTGRLRLA